MLFAGAAAFAGGICLTGFFHCKIEKTLPLVVSAIVFVMYGVGLFGHLEIGFALAAAALAICDAVVSLGARNNPKLYWGNKKL